MFPGGANIVVVGPGAHVPQPHKTIGIHAGFCAPGDDSLGSTPNNQCHPMNDSPWGTAGVYLSAIRESIPSQFSRYLADCGTVYEDFKNDWSQFDLPLGVGHLARFISYVVLHECGHTMGLVPDAASQDHAHNNCSCGNHHMDRGATRQIPMYLRSMPYLFWTPSNDGYLRFVFKRKENPTP